MDKYQRNGYDSREDYLQSLADDYAVPLDVVTTMADIMPNEEFDGLISILEDAEGMFGE